MDEDTIARIGTAILSLVLGGVLMYGISLELQKIDNDGDASAVEGR